VTAPGAEHPGYLIGERTADEDPDLVGGSASRARRALLRDPAAWTGAVLAVVVVAAALAGPLIAPHDPERQYRELMPLDGRALGPSEMFPLGTDVLGRDYLSRLLYAGRSTLLVGFGANVVAVLIGLLVGLIAGYAGSPRLALGRGRAVGLPVESVLMRLTDVGLAFPSLLLAIALTAVFGKSLALVSIVIAAVLWTTTARIVYGRVIVLRHAEFITAARALGTRDRRILARHLLPQILPIVIVYGTLGIATVILFEASLSFLGAGAPVGDPTWGTLLAQHLSQYRTDFRLLLLPGLAIFLTVLAFTLLGDALRDAFDPHGWRR
jgi:peptide/nickel transport system permease protein